MPHTANRGYDSGMASNSPEERKKIARMGGLARKAKLTRRERKNIASMGGWALRKKRWLAEQARKAQGMTTTPTLPEIVPPSQS